MTTDKAKNKAQEVKGKAKETIGKAVGNERLEAEGVADQTRATSSRPARRSRTRAKASSRELVWIADYRVIGVRSGGAT